MIAALAIGCTPAEQPPGPPALEVPIRCVLGDDCWITDYPDADPGPGARDHRGGTHTRDGHSGTDVAVRHAGQADATWVVAPVSGTVVRVRDGVPDGELVAEGPETTDERACGNAVVLDAGAGWELYLCHLRWGTVAVSPAERVAVGAPLGRVGWSGEADHPHVHLTVFHDGRKVDPFDGRYLDDGTAAAPGPLWSAPIPPPSEVDALVWAGFDIGPRVDDDTWPLDGGRAILPATAESLVLTVFLWRPEQGDVVHTLLRRPDGTSTSAEVVQPRNRPRQTWRIEKTWLGEPRPTGLWTAVIEWRRGERTRELRASTILR